MFVVDALNKSGSIPQFLKKIGKNRHEQSTTTAIMGINSKPHTLNIHFNQVNI